jgi:UDP-N-acetylmuramate dehydrogenase
LASKRAWYEEAEAALAGRPGAGVAFDVPLAPRTYIGIGGAARVFLAPATIDDLAWAVGRLHAAGVGFDVLGAGSNLIVADGGPSFAVLSTESLDACVIEAEEVRAGAGLTQPRLAQRAQKAGLSGLEFAEGIPGSVGGGMRMNAGWHDEEFGPRVTSLLTVDRRGTVETLANAPGFFAYRTSPGLGDRIVAEARLRLRPDDSARIALRMRGFRDQRVRTQPAGQRNAGCMFRNPSNDYAGRLIEACGLKGRRIGGAEVSMVHANFFVNHGGATCADVLRLLDEVRDEVRRRAGVALQPEVMVWR